MFAYYLLVGVPLLLALLMYSIKYTYRLNRVPYTKEILRGFFLIYFLLLAFRSAEIGADTWNYLSKFQSARQSTWIEYVFSRSSEQGYAFFAKLISCFTDSEQLFLTIIAAITIYPIAKLYMEESESPLLTIGLFLVLPMFQMLFSGLRQAIAMAFLPAAYHCIRERRLFKFLIVVWMASLFHTSAWVLLLLYPVYHARIPRSALIWVVPVLAAIIVFRRQLYMLLFTLLASAFYEEHGIIVETGATSMLLLFSIILVFSYLFLGSTDEETSGQRNVLILSIAVQTFSMVNRVAMRVNYYYLLLLPLLLPRVIRRIPSKNKWFASLVEFVCCVYFLVYFFRTAHNGADTLGIYPYIPFWNA